MEMNRLDFILKTAKFVGWEVKGVQIITPERSHYSAAEIVTGCLSGIEADQWNLCHKEFLFDRAIDKINELFRNGKSKCYVSLNSEAYVLFDKDRHPFGVGYINSNDNCQAKEDILQKYFIEVNK